VRNKIEGKSHRFEKHLYDSLGFFLLQQNNKETTSKKATKTPARHISGLSGTSPTNISSPDKLPSDLLAQILFLSFFIYLFIYLFIY
jgi:hypothetical protein